MTAAASEAAEAIADIGHRLETTDDVAELLAAVATAIDELPAHRAELALELRRRGFNNNDIAELAGVTRSRIAQLLGPVTELERRRIARAALDDHNTTKQGAQ